jgi:hypothetical protein
MNDSSTWSAPALSTELPAAAAAYRQGVAELVAGAGHSEALLYEAIAIDPSFVLGHVAVAVTEAIAGRAVPVIALDGPLTRPERQHVEIVTAALAGDGQRATDLRREHLMDYPGDLLVVWLPVLLAQCGSA